MKNYTFIKPYKTTIGTKDADALLKGAAPFQEINFKIGDKINGSPFGGVDTNRIVETRVGNVNLNIPPEYLKEEVVNQPTLVKPTQVSQDAEEKFYESLGLKNRGGYSPTIKAKGRFLIVVLLVAGYFAYKKFKK